MTDMFIEDEGFAEYEQAIRRSTAFLRQHGMEYEAVLLDSDLDELIAAKMLIGDKRASLATLADEAIKKSEERFSDLKKSAAKERSVPMPPRTRTFFVGVGSTLVVGLLISALQTANDDGYVRLAIGLIALCILAMIYFTWSPQRGIS